MIGIELLEVAEPRQPASVVHADHTLDASARDEGKRLQRLEGAARGRQEMRVARDEQQPSVGVDDRNRTMMYGVGRVAAGEQGRTGRRMGGW